MGLWTPNTRKNAPIYSVPTPTVFDDPCPCCGGPGPCLCCCCPDQSCVKSFHLTLSSVSVTFFTTTYSLPGSYCITSWVRGIGSTSYRYFSVNVGTGVWVQLFLRLSTFCCVDTGTIGWEAYASGWIIDTNSTPDRTGYFLLHEYSTGSGTGECAICTDFDPVDSGALNVLFGGYTAGTDPCVIGAGQSASASMVVANGDCGDSSPCCEFQCATDTSCLSPCCEEGATWFCATEIPPPQLYMTKVSGPCPDPGGFPGFPNVLRSADIVNGTCLLYVSNLGSLTYGLPGIYIACDGTVYGFVDDAVASPAGGDCIIAPFGSVQHLAAIGSVTTITSCSPVDIEITLTGGQCSGGVYRVTE